MFNTSARGGVEHGAHNTGTTLNRGAAMHALASEPMMAMAFGGQRARAADSESL